MAVEEFGHRLAAALGDADVTVGASGGEAYARATVDVPADRWPTALRTARDALSCDFFDWLSAVDEGAAGMTVVAHVWSTTDRRGLLVRTRLPADALRVPSAVDVYPGAAWHERETHEMFGVDFPGHPGGLAPLLLPPEFEGHPLRKDFVLASRVVKAWPGAKEPGEAAGGGRRAPARPPGVPDPAEWGPAAQRVADSDAADRRVLDPGVADAGAAEPPVDPGVAGRRAVDPGVADAGVAERRVLDPGAAGRRAVDPGVADAGGDAGEDPA